MAQNNPVWGYKRIRDCLIYLGFTVSFMTVKRIMNTHGFFAPPDGRENADFNLFFKSHQNVIASCDFCTKEVVTPNSRRQPDGAGCTKSNRCLGWKIEKHRISDHDHDPLFQGCFTDIPASAGRKTKMTQPRCPEQNGHIESFIKSFKTEWLNHLILTSERQLRYVVKAYCQYYKRERPHSGLGGKMINPWPQDAEREITEFSRLGGLLKCWRNFRVG